MPTIDVGAYNMSWLSGDNINTLPEQNGRLDNTIVGGNYNTTPQSSSNGGGGNPIPAAVHLPGWSEYAWLRKLFNADGNTTQIDVTDVNLRCKYWLNALTNLKMFIQQKNPGFVALLEMNVNTTNNDNIQHKTAKMNEDETITIHPGSVYEVPNQPPTPIVDNSVGTNAISLMLQSINQKNNYTTQYKLLCGQVSSFGSWIGICIVYDEKQVGEVTDFTVVDNTAQFGRPLLMAYTNKGYLLAAMHGAQNPGFAQNIEIADSLNPGKMIGEFDNYMITKNQAFFEKECAIFSEGKVVDEVFLAGDFNDRYAAIKDIKVKNMIIKYNGIPPKTACPNWDSAGIHDCLSQKCVKTKTNPDYYTNTNGPALINSNKSLVQPPPGKALSVALDTEYAAYKIEDSNGKMVDNYLYSGDTVYGREPTGNIMRWDDSQIDNPTLFMKINIVGKIGGNTGVNAHYISKCSDHPLVYGTFNLLRRSSRDRNVFNYIKATKSNSKKVGQKFTPPPKKKGGKNTRRPSKNNRKTKRRSK